MSQPRDVQLTGESGEPVPIPYPIANFTQLVPFAYDYVSLSYTGANLTGAIFKQGGAGGTTVATLAMTYTGANLTSVTRT